MHQSRADCCLRIRKQQSHLTLEYKGSLESPVKVTFSPGLNSKRPFKIYLLACNIKFINLIGNLLALTAL